MKKQKTKTKTTYFEYRTIGAHIFRTFPSSNMSITQGKLLEVFILHDLFDVLSPLVAKQANC